MCVWCVCAVYVCSVCSYSDSLMKSDCVYICAYVCCALSYNRISNVSAHNLYSKCSVAIVNNPSVNMCLCTRVQGYSV